MNLGRSPHHAAPFLCQTGEAWSRDTAFKSPGPWTSRLCMEEDESRATGCRDRPGKLTDPKMVAKRQSLCNNYALVGYLFKNATAFPGTAVNNCCLEMTLGHCWLASPGRDINTFTHACAHTHTHTCSHTHCTSLSYIGYSALVTPE